MTILCHITHLDVRVIEITEKTQTRRYLTRETIV